jgi:hypothetical protein
LRCEIEQRMGGGNVNDPISFTARNVLSATRQHSFTLSSKDRA